MPNDKRDKLIEVLDAVAAAGVAVYLVYTKWKELQNEIEGIENDPEINADGDGEEVGDTA